MTELKDAATETAERKRMDAIWWAGVLIWIGLALGAEYADILPAVGDWGEWWPWIFIGVGPWSLALNVYRQASSWPNPRTWDWIWTACSCWWPWVPSWTSAESWSVPSCW